jgi:hypothetical protein
LPQAAGRSSLLGSASAKSDTDRNAGRRTMGDGLRDWEKLKDDSGWETLVVGNGLSINIWSKFAYSNLFDQASPNLNPSASQLFSDFKTKNFETVLEALWHAERTLTALKHDAAEVTRLYEDVQSALFQAVHQVHVPWQDIAASTLKQISDAMSVHRHVFTLNYDLLTYWSAMHGGPKSAIKDFFWAEENTFDINDATFEEGKTGLFYLHGGLHLWQDSQSGRTGKWIKNSKRALLKDLEANFKASPDRQPVLVSEGTSEQKMDRIRKSVYLTHARQTLLDNTSDTVIFGANFEDQDKHISEAIDAGPQRRIAISIRPGAKAQNKATITRYQSKFPEHDLLFFDSTTHALGDSSLTVG